MKKIIEHLDGFRWHEGDTSSFPFQKDSEIWNELILEGCEVEYIPQSEKDAFALEQYKQDSIQKVQSMLDAEAQSRGYDNINSIGKYIGYDNAFRAECESLGAWTAACWAKCYELQASGSMPEDILSEMPVL